MRKNHQEQPSLLTPWARHAHASELEALSDILDADPTITELITLDLVGEGIDRKNGREGMTGEQTLRAALVRQIHGYSYETLSFHLADSLSFQRFCRIGLEEKTPSKSTLQRNIKRIRAETWEAINRRLVVSAKKDRVEKGKKVRIDCTVVASPIHHPTDSSLLYDVVRVIARLMHQAVIGRAI